SYNIFKNGIVEDFMEEECYSLQIHDSIYKAAEIMSKYELDNLAVVDEVRKVRGTVSFSIIMKALLKGIPLEVELENIMIKQFTGYYADDPINELSFQFTRIPVIDRNGRLIGNFPSTRRLLNQFVELTDKIHSLEEIVKMYEVCFDTAYEGITVVDQHGIIRLFNNSYSRFVQMRKEEVIGKHCTEVIENTRLPVVLETGIPERGLAVILQGQEMVAHVIPIWKNNKVIGAIGMLVFEGGSELSKIFDRMQTLKNKTSDKQVTFEYPKKDEETITFDKIVGDSRSIGEVKKIARRAAKTMATVLIIGESGVGKELFAKSIHNLSPVNKGPLISINCAAIPDELLESELFGYTQGAFTGARKGGKPGKFEVAHNGTLFLDEIGDMSLHLQAKLLRVLQDQKFERVGGISEVKVNVRIIAATNKTLEQLVEEGTFRKDLYYRLNIISLHIPSLKDRKTDIPILVSKLLEETYKKYNLPPVNLSREAMEYFIHYDWPGNVREMANLLESLVVLSDKRRIQLEDLPPHLTDYLPNNKSSIKPNEKTGQISTHAINPLITTDLEFDQQESTLHQRNSSTTSNLFINVKEANEERERELISNILQKVDGNKSKAAKILGIHRSTLYKKMNKHSLN
ncbi:sigma 54-interacting transcriptional regulator, partial [Peribacillus sp. NPDC060186]